MEDINRTEELAIEAAVKNDWDSAISLNKEIIVNYPENVGAHLRLGFSLMQKKNFGEAKNTYKAVLSFQPQNQIAKDNLDKIEILEENINDISVTKISYTKIDPNLFLDVPGKTKTIELVNLGQKKVIATLSVSQEVDIKCKKRKLEIRTQSGDYVGTLPDDVSKRLIYFIDEGSLYTAYVKDALINRVLVFVKELSKGEKVHTFISFPQTSQPLYHPLHEEEKREDEDDEEYEDTNGTEDDYLSEDSNDNMIDDDDEGDDEILNEEERRAISEKKDSDYSDE